VIGRHPKRSVVFAFLLLAPGPLSGADKETADLAAARAVFARNLNAIRTQDRIGYLACYLDAGDHFVRTKAALKAGARLLVHSVSDMPVDEEFLSLAKANGTIYCPTLTVLAGYWRMNKAALTQTPPLVDDPNGCVDAATRAKVADSAKAGTAGRAERVALLEKRIADNDRYGYANLKRVFDAGIPIAMSTDAGNPLTLHGPSVYAEMEAMQAAGLTAMQVLVASTRGGARAMGRDNEFGTLEKGKEADAIVVAADPTADIKSLRQLKWVARGGVVRSVEELKAIVAAEKP
jgi:hypothetical protein